MKSTIKIALFIIFTLSLISNIQLYRGYTNLEDKINNTNKGITFIWNDDEESIPIDGSKIQIEYTDKNNIYLKPLDE